MYKYKSILNVGRSVLRRVRFVQGDYVIVDFSINCVCSCYKCYDVDITVYLHVLLISCPCFVCNRKA